MDGKTYPEHAEGDCGDVKTNPRGYSYVSLVRKKYWYFVHKEVSIPMGEEYGSAGFEARLFQLMQLYGLDAPDDRCVYFIGWEGGPIKIGVATDPKSRVQILQVACPYSLRIEAVVHTGGVPVERDYHKRFAAHRLRNEWFERVPEIEAEIERLNGRTRSGSDLTDA